MCCSTVYCVLSLYSVGEVSYGTPGFITAPGDGRLVTGILWKEGGQNTFLEDRPTKLKKGPKEINEFCLTRKRWSFRPEGLKPTKIPFLKRVYLDSYYIIWPGRISAFWNTDHLTFWNMDRSIMITTHQYLYFPRYYTFNACSGRSRSNKHEDQVWELPLSLNLWNVIIKMSE